MRCHVVVTCHEIVDRDDDNRIVGLRPLQQGSFADKLGAYFTDVFRQLVQPKALTPEKLALVKLEQYGCKNTAEYKAIQDEFPGEVIYLWQTRPDGIARCKTCLVGAPLYIPALFKYYVKYERK